MRRDGVEVRRALREERVDGRNDVTQVAAPVRRNRVDRRQQLRTDDDRGGARILNHVRVVGRLPQRVERNRHGADLDRTEKTVRERGPVEHQQQDAVLRPDAERAQRRSGAVHVAQQVVVRDALISTFDRDAAAAAFGDVAVDEMRRRVEPLGDAEGFGGQSHEL